MKNIILISTMESLNLNNIGGLESFYRRLFKIEYNENYKIRVILHNAHQRKKYIKEVQNLEIQVDEVKNFEDSLFILNGYNGSTMVIDNYLSPIEKLKYFKFMLLHRNINFSKYYFGKLPLAQRLEHYLRKIVLGNYNAYSFSKRNTIVGMDVSVPPMPTLSLVKGDKSIRPLNIVFIGRFDFNKGIDKILYLAQRFPDRNEINFEVNGYFAHGEVDSYSFLKACNELSITVNEVNHSEWSPKVDMSIEDILSRTDIVLLPYNNLRGTMDPPYLLLEAMSCSKPCITSDVGSVTEYYGNSDFVADPDSWLEQTVMLLETVAIDHKVVEIESKRLSEQYCCLFKGPL